MLPEFGLVFSPDQWILRSHHHWNIGSTDELERAQRVCHLRLEPGVASHDRDAENIGLWRLDQEQYGLLVGSAGSGGVFVDDDLASSLSPAGEACHYYRCYNRDPAEFHSSTSEF